VDEFFIGMAFDSFVYSIVIHLYYLFKYCFFLLLRKIADPWFLVQIRNWIAYLYKLVHWCTIKEFKNMTLKYRIATPIFQGKFKTLDKQQIKSQKFNFWDAGLLHTLMDIPDGHSLLGNSKKISPSKFGRRFLILKIRACP